MNIHVKVMEDVNISSAMSEYKCGDQMAKVLLHWLYAQGCRAFHVFPPTQSGSRKHNLEEAIFYWLPRCA